MFPNIFITILFLGCQNPALPEEYKSYKTLEEGVSSEHYKISLFFEDYSEESDFNFQEPIFYTTVNNNAVVKLKKKGNEKMYYKLDDYGKVTDSISTLVTFDKTEENHKDEYMFVNGFLIDDKNYNSWGIDGNSNKKLLTKINENLSWEKVRISKAISENKNYIVGTDDHEIYFYNKEKLSILFLGDFNIADFQELKGRETYIWGTITKIFIATREQIIFKKKSKKNFEIHTGGGSQSISESGYLGNWFTSIDFKGEPLKMKFENLIASSEFTSLHNERAVLFNLSYYNYENKNFAILYVSYPSSYYIIEKK